MMLQACTRRQFLASAGAGVAGAVLLPHLDAAEPASNLLGNRFLTFNTVIRVNQIEVTRTRNEGVDEGKLHTPEAARKFREAFARGWPGGKMTWAFSWLALDDTRPNYRAIRELVAGYYHQYGDEITFIPGGYFANMYNSRQQVNEDLHDALVKVGKIVGGGYRPRSIVAGFLAADNLRFLAEHEGIHVCQGNIWSQYAVDNGDGDGAIVYPYYPSREHFCKPAQGKHDFIDCVNLDGWTCDFLAARRAGFAEGFNSRLGVGPIETIMHHGHETGLKEMMHTTAVHFDRGFELNRFAWVTNCWELCLTADGSAKANGNLECLPRWLGAIRRRWPSARCVTQGEFGETWRRHFRANDFDLRFEERGSGIGGSDADKEIRWFMNKDFRLALLRNWQKNESEQVIDFTRYDLEAREPQGMGRNWSLMNVRNQKGTRPQDKPGSIRELAKEDRQRILRRHPELL